MGTRPRLEITSAIRAALEAVARAERVYVPGRDSASILELPKLALAEAVLRAARAHGGRVFLVTPTAARATLRRSASNTGAKVEGA